MKMALIQSASGTNNAMTDRLAVPEFEITDEMMRAGLDAWCEYDSRFEDTDDAVRRIWHRMVAAMLKADAGLGQHMS